MGILHLLGTLLLLSCINPFPAGTSAPDPGITWTELTPHAPWPESYNYQMFSIRDTLWVLHPRGTWCSADARQWHPSSLPNVVQNQAFLDYVCFKGALYGLGSLRGNIERYDFSPMICRSSDLRTWDTLTTQSNLPKRFFYHPFVFNDHIWIIGGEDTRTAYQDIWRSPDGIHWTQVADRLPFGKRSSAQVVVLNGALYLLDHDVWRSTDGITWTRICEAILPGEQIFGYTALVYQEKIWLLGCNRTGTFTSQVLYSADGQTWQTHQAPWRPRGGVAAAVHQHKIYLTGGKYGGTPNHPDFRYDNDLWAMEITTSP
ncbi:MAG: hypothetical protein SF053_20175 [Bacteroidia bacterium]|nr:hypothetical protein [Bacteroidia bacterium]